MVAKDHFWSDKELGRQESFFELFKECPIPDNEILKNLGLFISKTEFARTLYLYELYQKILNVHGVIMELFSQRTCDCSVESRQECILPKTARY